MSSKFICAHCDRHFHDANALFQHMRATHPKERAEKSAPKASDSMGDYYRDMRDMKAMIRAKHGIPCPKCREEQPRRQPTILTPGDRCRVHKPPYVDPRPELTQKDFDELC